MSQETLFDIADQAVASSSASDPQIVGQMGGKDLHVRFDGGPMSSDGGGLLLRGVDEQIGLSETLAAALTDRRDGRYVDHQLIELFRQRIYQIALGYEDANDCDYLREDPGLKVAAGRLPESGEPLASQPTMTRLENGPSRTELYRMGEVFVETFLASYEEAPQLIVLDVDDTDTTVHGNQQLALFNSYYGDHCYMPLHVYEGLSGRLITSLLKPGRLEGQQMRAILARLVGRIRASWPEVTILFRGDSHFTYQEVMRWIEDRENVHYVTGQTPHTGLQNLSKGLLEKAQAQFEASGEPVQWFRARGYRAQAWDRTRRVILKVEAGPQGTNLRAVITDLKQARPRALYRKLYCGRWRAERYIKEHKIHLQSDRASCHRFEANQFRLFLHSAAYVLLETLRREVLISEQWTKATIRTLQLRLLKLACVVQELKTRVKLIFPSHCPVESALRRSFDRLIRMHPT